MKTLILLSLLIVSGCATVYDPVAEKYLQEAADGAMAKSIYLVCEATTLGALKRRFPNDEDMFRFIKDCVWLRQ